MEKGEIDVLLKFYDQFRDIINKEVKLALKSQVYETFQSPMIDLLAGALSHAQGAYLELRFNRRNPVSLNEYADIEAIHKATRPALETNGLSTTQQPLSLGDGTILVTKLTHCSGQYIECRSRLTLLSGETRLFVSQLNEYKKQHLMSLLSIAAIGDPDDDDCLVETEMKRLEQKSGTSIRHNYATSPDQEYVRINKSELDELDYALSDPDMKDIYDSILHDLRITCLADIPKESYRKTINRVNEIITARKKLK